MRSISKTLLRYKCYVYQFFLVFRTSLLNFEILLNLFGSLLSQTCLFGCQKISLHEILSILTYQFMSLLIFLGPYYFNFYVISTKCKSSGFSSISCLHLLSCLAIATRTVAIRSIIHMALSF